MIGFLFMTVATIGWVAMFGLVLTMTPFGDGSEWWGALFYQIFMISLVLAIGVMVLGGWHEVLK